MWSSGRMIILFDLFLNTCTKSESICNSSIYTQNAHKLNRNFINREKMYQQMSKEMKPTKRISSTVFGFQFTKERHINCNWCRNLGLKQNIFFFRLCQRVAYKRFSTIVQIKFRRLSQPKRSCPHYELAFR